MAPKQKRLSDFATRINLKEIKDLKSKASGKQHVVLTALIYNPKDSSHKKSIDDFFNKKDWGKLRYVMQFKTLSGLGGPGGRTDVVFAWSGTHNQLGKFSVQRFGMGNNTPHWLEDYISNNREIIPGAVLEKLKKLRQW